MTTILLILSTLFALLAAFGVGSVAGIGTLALAVAFLALAHIPWSGIKLNA